MHFKKFVAISVSFFLLFTVVANASKNINNYKWIDVAEHIYLVQSDSWHGTGFAVKDDHGRVFIVTNRHVCGFHNTPLTIKDYLGNESIVQKRWLSRNTDLCALEAPKDAISLAMAKTVAVGTKFITAGYSLVKFMSQHEGHVIGFADEPVWIAQDIPSELSEEQCKQVGQLIKGIGSDGKMDALCKIELKDIAVTDMFIGSGASGSPIIDAQTNEVIGVLFGGRQVGQSIVLASFIKIEILRAFLKAIP